MAGLPVACELHDGGMYKVMTEQPAFDVPFRDVQIGCWTPVFRFALALTNDWDVAEDLAQEAFTRLWVHRATVDWERPMLPWLLNTTSAWDWRSSHNVPAYTHVPSRTPRPSPAR